MKDAYDGLAAKEIEDFVEHKVWKAMVATLEERLELIRNELEVGKDLTEGGELKLLTFEDIKLRQGEAKNCRYVLILPSIIQKHLEAKEEVSRNKTKGE